jgi:hypothetical protein
MSEFSGKTGVNAGFWPGGGGCVQFVFRLRGA